MAGSKSNYLENQIVDHIFNGNGTNWTAPTSVYVALFTAQTEASQTEVAAGGYARQAVVATSAGWTVSSNAVTNAGAITFGPATASWGTVTGVGIYDALTNGNLLYWSDLTTSKTVDDGDSVTFAAGALDISED